MVGAGEIIYSMCDQAAVADVFNNEGWKGRRVEGKKLRKLKTSKPVLQEKKENIDVKASLNLVSPNGDETLQAGEKFLITWKSDREIEKVKLEYSPDNGTTYLPIAVDVPDTGHYEWIVPHHISCHCLVRVSEVKGFMGSGKLFFTTKSFRRLTYA